MLKSIILSNIKNEIKFKILDFLPLYLIKNQFHSKRYCDTHYLNSRE